MGMLSVGLLVGSIMMLTAPRHGAGSREAEVSAFGSSVGNWSRNYRTQLQRASMVLFVGGNDSSVVLRQDTAAVDSAIRDQGADVPKFEPLFFSSTGTAGIAQLLSSTHFAPRKVAEHGDTSGLGVEPNSVTLYLNVTDGMTGVRSTLGPLRADRTVMRPTFSQTPAPEVKCRGRGGQPYHGNMCALFLRLKAMCVRVRRTETGHWALANVPPVGSGGVDHSTAGVRQATADTLDSAGCEWLGGGVGGAGRWAARGYQLVRAGRPAANGRPAAAVDFHDFHFAVRHERDPFLYQRSVTHGTGEFPMSSHDSLVLGAFLLFASALLGLQPFLACRAMRRRMVEAVPYDEIERRESNGRAQWPDEDEERGKVVAAEGKASARGMACAGALVDRPSDAAPRTRGRGAGLDVEMVAVDIGASPACGVRQRSISPTQTKV